MNLTNIATPKIAASLPFFSVYLETSSVLVWLVIGGLAKRAHPARARYLNKNLALRNRDLQPGGTEIESLEEKSDSL